MLVDELVWSHTRPAGHNKPLLQDIQYKNSSRDRLKAWAHAYAERPPQATHPARDGGQPAVSLKILLAAQRRSLLQCEEFKREVVGGLIEECVRGEQVK